MATINKSNKIHACLKGIERHHFSLDALAHSTEYHRSTDFKEYHRAIDYFQNDIDGRLLHCQQKGDLAYCFYKSLKQQLFIHPLPHLQTTACRSQDHDRAALCSHIFALCDLFLSKSYTSSTVCWYQSFSLLST